MAVGDRCTVVEDDVPCRGWAERRGLVATTGVVEFMCTKHYFRWRRYGDPLTVHPQFVPLGEQRPDRPPAVVLRCTVPADVAGRVELAAVRAGLRSRATFVRNAVEAALRVVEASP